VIREHLAVVYKAQLAQHWGTAVAQAQLSLLDLIHEREPSTPADKEREADWSWPGLVDGLSLS